MHYICRLVISVDGHKDNEPGPGKRHHPLPSSPSDPTTTILPPPRPSAATPPQTMNKTKASSKFAFPLELDMGALMASAAQGPGHSAVVTSTNGSPVRHGVQSNLPRACPTSLPMLLPFGPLIACVSCGPSVAQGHSTSQGPATPQWSLAPKTACCVMSIPPFLPMLLLQGLPAKPHNSCHCSGMVDSFQAGRLSVLLLLLLPLIQHLHTHTHTQHACMKAGRTCTQLPRTPPLPHLATGGHLRAGGCAHPQGSQRQPRALWCVLLLH